MELKPLKVEVTISGVVCSNRTFMELKLISEECTIKLSRF